VKNAWGQRDTTERNVKKIKKNLSTPGFICYIRADRISNSMDTSDHGSKLTMKRGRNMLNRLTRAILALSTITFASVALFAQKVEDPNPPQIKPSTPYLDTISRGASVCNSTITGIPDNTPAGTSTVINFADSGTINDVIVELSVTHSWVGDLIVSVEHDGTMVTLVDQPGVPASTFGCSGNNISASFDDTAAMGVEGVCPATDPVINGAFNAVVPLSAFDGDDVNGDWTLTISDNAAGDTGTLDQWCLDIDYVMAPTCTVSNLVISCDDPQDASAQLFGDCPDGADLYCAPPGGGNILIASGIVFSGSAQVDIGQTDAGYQYWATANGDPGTVLFGPVTANCVPTLGEWGMIAFVLLLVGAGLVYMRRNKQQMA
jgi:subtilisin-like proprotein convertase family protein